MTKGLIFGILGFLFVWYGVHDLKPFMKPKRFRRREAPKPVEPPPPPGWNPPGGPGPWSSHGGYGGR